MNGHVDAGRPTPRDSRTSAARAIGPLAVAAALVAGYHLLRWSSVNEFVATLDDIPVLFGDFTRHYLPQAREILDARPPVPGYIYSAFFALLLLPFTTLTDHAAVTAWGLAQVTIGLALFLVPLRRLAPLRGWRLALYAGMFFMSFPVLHCLRWGQVSMFLALLVILAFDADRSGRSELAGVLVAVASAIKFFPAIFMLYFVTKRDWRAVAAFAGTYTAAYVLIPAMVMGPGRFVAFEIEILRGLVNSDWVAADLNSQYLPHVLTRWTHAVPDASLVNPAWYALAIGLCIANVIIVVLATRRGRASVYPLALLFLSTPLFVSTSWPHYFVYLPFCQAMALDRLHTNADLPRHQRKAALVLLGLSVGASNMLVFDLLGGWESYNGAGALLLSNMFLTACIHLLLMSEHAASAPTPSRQGTSTGHHIRYARR